MHVHCLYFVKKIKIWKTMRLRSCCKLFNKNMVKWFALYTLCCHRDRPFHPFVPVLLGLHGAWASADVVSDHVTCASQNESPLVALVEIPIWKRNKLNCYTVFTSFWEYYLQETLWRYSRPHSFIYSSQWAYRRFINLIIVVVVFHHGGGWRPLSLRLSVFHTFQFILAVFLVILLRYERFPWGKIYP